MEETTTSRYKPFPDFPELRGRTQDIIAWGDRNIYTSFHWGSELRYRGDQREASWQEVFLILCNNMPPASQVYLPACLLDLVPDHPKHIEAPLLLLNPDDFLKETKSLGGMMHTYTVTYPHHAGTTWQGLGDWELHPSTTTPQYRHNQSEPDLTWNF